mmetsp:Transcript_31618/g.62547  ORF Transcript_31618/g.62547 Transcript_31618/m.62547 type:complete len:158 (+) Transcript_31618:950-1423(+)
MNDPLRELNTTRNHRPTAKRTRDSRSHCSEAVTNHLPLFLCAKACMQVLRKMRMDQDKRTLSTHFLLPPPQKRDNAMYQQHQTDIDDRQKRADMHGRLLLEARETVRSRSGQSLSIQTAIDCTTKEPRRAYVKSRKKVRPTRKASDGPVTHCGFFFA